MSISSIYKCLIVVEGTTDVSTYRDLLVRYGCNGGDFAIFPARGGGVLNTECWGSRPGDGVSLLDTVKNDIGRSGFCSIILLIDADSAGEAALDSYQRRSDGAIPYVDPGAKPNKTNYSGYWLLDAINGANGELPVYGIVVPRSSTGCLETDLLSSYGFPTDGQTEYSQFVDIIKKASVKWQIPKKGDGKDWWEENEKAKLDKFIYLSLDHGFSVSRRTPTLPSEPDVISDIKRCMNGVHPRP